MTFRHLVFLLFCAVGRVAVAVAGMSFALCASHPVDIKQLGEREKNQLMRDYYNIAIQAYSGEDYPKAIEYCQKILEIDKNQYTASELLHKSTAEMAAKDIEKGGEAEELIEKGQYQQARDIYIMLTQYKPDDALRQDIFERLGKVTAVLPNINGIAKGSDLIRRAMNYYLLPPSNPKLALLTLHYANQKYPGDKKTQLLLKILQREFPTVANEVVPVQGLDIIQQKLDIALSYIHNDQYTFAIQECDEVLALEPDNVTALERKGSAHYVLWKRTKSVQSKNEAKKAWQKALKITPNNKQLKEFLANLK